MESFTVLTVRLLVGIVLGLGGAFAGLIFNSLLVPSPAAGDELAFAARMLVLGFAASAAGLLAWFSLTESRIGAAATFVVAGLSGSAGAAAAYFIGDAIVDHPDLFILNQRLTQVVVFGTVAGSNAYAVVLGLYLFGARRRASG